MYDVQAIKSRVDLLSVVEADLGPPRRRSGRWLSFVCPFHDDSEGDGGSLRVTPDTGTWFCFGCHEQGDAITWIRKRQNLTFGEACQQLGGTRAYSASTHGIPTPRQSIPRAPVGPPDQTWQSAVGTAAMRAAINLWEPVGKSDRDYLESRGLHEDTLLTFQIGCNPGRYYMPEVQTSDGHDAVVARGITIPIQVQGVLWALKIRQPEGSNPKYVQVAGGRPGLFGQATLIRPVALVTEGECDAMLAWQEASDLVGVCSTSGGAKTWLREWSLHLLTARMILVAYDSDKTGEEAAASVVAELGSRARRVTVPKGKDITEYWQAGGNVRQWIESLLT